MGRIFAIGGGEITKGENDRLNAALVALSGKAAPRLLFIPTASRDAAGYIETISRIFGGLGCQVKALCLYSPGVSDEDAARLLSWCDIVYVGGGDTVSMMDVWRQRGIDKLLISAYERGVILAGISAGSICWFRFGHSDSKSFHTDGTWEYCRACGLGLIPAAHCPHCNEPGRGSFDHMMAHESLPGVALSNGAALIEQDGVFHVMFEKDSAYACLLSHHGGKLVKRPILEGQHFTLQHSNGG